MPFLRPRALEVPLTVGDGVPGHAFLPLAPMLSSCLRFIVL